MLNVCIDRAGSNPSGKRPGFLNQAKKELRRLSGRE
jgi:hypothetical protein